MMRYFLTQFRKLMIGAGWLLLAGCSASTLPPYNSPPTPANMVLLSNTYDDGLSEGSQPTSIWIGNRIYSSMPVRYYDLGDSFHVIKDSVPVFKDSINFFEGIERIIAMRLRSDGQKLICVRTGYPDVSLGTLEEVDLSSWSQNILVNSDTNVSSAEYLSNDSIIYYTYGSYSSSNPAPSDAGYYLLIKSTGQRQLLLHHISDLGPGETLNGFDISPDHSKIIVPSVGWNRSPIVFEFNLQTHESDTLPIAFNTSRRCLYLRYNHDGSRILYSSYPIQAIEGNPGDGSEVGIINRATLQKTVLNTNPYPDYSTVICLFPDWSPDERSIVYGSARVFSEPAGQVSLYQATILKTLN